MGRRDKDCARSPRHPIKASRVRCRLHPVASRLPALLPLLGAVIFVSGEADRGPRLPAPSMMCTRVARSCIGEPVWPTATHVLAGGSFDSVEIHCALDVARITSIDISAPCHIQGNG
jgi:hypothetical protein